MSLNDDVARVAALRRMAPERLAEALERSAQTERRTRHAQRARILEMLFLPYDGHRQDMRVFDRLPARSREVLRQLDGLYGSDVSAERWLLALQAFGGDEQALILAIAHFLPSC